MQAEFLAKRKGVNGKSNNGGGGMVLAVTDKNKIETRVQSSKKNKHEMILAVGCTGDSTQIDWILDSGAIRHLVKEETFLLSKGGCSHEITMSYGDLLQLTRQVLDVDYSLTFTAVYGSY